MQLCDYGCNNEAKYYSRFTKKYRCSMYANQCPNMRKKFSDVNMKDIQYFINEKGCYICISHSYDRDGYPMICRNSKKQKMSRYVLAEKLNREIKDNYLALHTCDNPNCINPNHLYEGTHRDNTNDMIKRNRRNFTMSEETKKKLSIINRGKKHTEDSKKKISESGMGRKVSLETRKKLSFIRMGHSVSDETRYKISKANSGKIHTDEHHAKIQAARKQTIKKTKIADMRLVYWLYNIGYTKKDIATRMNISFNKVRNLLRGYIVLFLEEDRLL